MPALKDICRICLRAERKLFVVTDEISEYYDEITCYCLETAEPQYCSECKHQLIKMFNFKQKCLKAAQILQKWIKTRNSAKKPLTSLHTLLPPHPLTTCIQDNGNIYTYHWEEPQCSLRSQFEESHGDTILNEEIKLERDCYLTDSIALKSEELPNHFQEVFIENHNVKKSEKIDNELQYNVEIETNNYRDDINEQYHNVDDENDNLDDENDNIDDENDNVDDENGTEVVELADDNSLNSGDDYDFDAEVRKKRKKKSLAELANINLTAEDIDDGIDNKKAQKTFIKYINHDKVVAKLKSINKELSGIQKNWEKACLIQLPDVSLSNNKDTEETKRCLAKRKIVDKEDLRAQKSVKRKGLLAQLASLSVDLDSIHGSCEKIINYKEGLLNPKERLKAELTAQFATCGELRTEKGFAIDKNVIMGCFDRVSECLMRRLWRFVHGKPTLDPMAIRLLKHIQIKYQNEQEFETVFDIEYLNTEEKVREEFFEKRKTYSCYLNSKYKCEKCYLGFKYEAQLEHHINSHEASAGDFACPICGVRHRTKKTLDSHSKSHETVFKCKLCPLVTYYRGSMKNHFHQHRGMLYKCDLCATTFKSKSAKQTHLGRYHRDPHICTVCGLEVTNEQKHTCTKDQVENASEVSGEHLSCLQCNLSFPTQVSYRAHLKTHGPNKYTTLRKVKAERPKKKPIFDCRVCNAVGTSMGWLMVHFSSEHPSADMSLLYADKQKHLCHVCGKGFANVYNMRDHLNLHTGARPFACDACPARFHRSYALAQHRLTHLPPAKGCTYCGKKFRSQSNLNNHVRSHIGNRCYKCNVCGKGFLHRNALNEHIRGVHHKLRRVRKRGSTEPGTKRRAMSTDESSD